MFRMGIERLVLSLNHFKLSISLNNVCDFLCLSWILIALAHTLIALVHTLIALANLNSTDKMHRLYNES